MIAAGDPIAAECAAGHALWVDLGPPVRVATRSNRTRAGRGDPKARWWVEPDGGRPLCPECGAELELVLVRT